MDLHIKAVHLKIKSHICEICPSTFTAAIPLKIHVSTVHEGKKPHKCNLCIYSFGLAQSLKNHIEQVHEGIHINVMLVTIVLKEQSI